MLQIGVRQYRGLRLELPGDLFALAAYSLDLVRRKTGHQEVLLNSLCRQAVDRSALELIHERLLLEAWRNLVYTSMRINLVSDALSFADPGHFTRFSKRAT